MTARVLVVDDAPANVKLLGARLSAECFDVVTATNGPDALAVCERAECAREEVEAIEKAAEQYNASTALGTNQALL